MKASCQNTFTRHASGAAGAKELSEYRPMPSDYLDSLDLTSASGIAFELPVASLGDQKCSNSGNWECRKNGFFELQRPAQDNLLFPYFYFMKTNRISMALVAITMVLVITAFRLPPPSGQQIPLTSGQQTPFTDKFWVLESSTVVPAIDLDMDGKPDGDIRVMMEDCEKDDAEMFKANGKTMKHQGNDKCDEDEEELSESGTWKYDPATKQLTVHHYDTDKPQTITIKEVSSAKMVMTYNFTSNKGKHAITAVYRVK